MRMGMRGSIRATRARVRVGGSVRVRGSRGAGQGRGCGWGCASCSGAVRHVCHRWRGSRRVVLARREVLAHDAVDLDERGLEGEVDVGRVVGRGLDEGEVVILGKVLCVLDIDRLLVL